MEASKHEAAKIAADHAAFAAVEVKCWGCSGPHRASKCPYIDAVKKLNEKGELGSSWTSQRRRESTQPSLRRAHG